MKPLVWFRSDLRVADNTALHEACRIADDGVIAVFTICPDQWKTHDWASVKVDFLLRNLVELRRALGACNIPLLIVEEPRFAAIPGRLLEIAEQHHCDGLWFNIEYEVNERRRDQRVTETFERAGRPVRAHTDQVVLSPESIRTTQDSFYTVFTPYKRRWITAVKEPGTPPTLPMPGRKADTSAITNGNRTSLQHSLTCIRIANWHVAIKATSYSSCIGS